MSEENKLGRKTSTIAIKKESFMELKKIIQKLKSNGVIMCDKTNFVSILIDNLGDRVADILIEKHKKEEKEFQEKLNKINKEIFGE